MSGISDLLENYLQPRISPHDFLALESDAAPFTVQFDNKDQVQDVLQNAPAPLRLEAEVFRAKFMPAPKTRKVGVWHPPPYPPADILSHPLPAEETRRAIDRFTRERLSSDWQSGPPYHPLPPEVDSDHTAKLVAGREVINRRVLTPAELRDRNTKVLFAFAPVDDFERKQQVQLEDGSTVSWTNKTRDVMKGMTSVANGPKWQISSLSPNYAWARFKALFPRERRYNESLDETVKFTEPRNLEEFESMLREFRPEVVCLSGLTVNTRSLLQMQYLARQYGVKEVWLGNYAAASSFKALKTFDRLFYGEGDHYVYHHFVGDGEPPFHHPAPEDMVAAIDWIVGLDANGEPVRAEFQTLHLILRSGCNMGCGFCPQTSMGAQMPPYSIQELKDAIDWAAERKIQHVYFMDPDFAREWEAPIDEDLIRYVHSKKMKWSFLGPVPALQKNYRFMVDHGLASVYLGIESLAPSLGENLKDIGGRGWQKTNATVRIINRLYAWGVTTYGLYMLGHPGVSIADEEEGLARLGKILALSQISNRQLFVGSADYEAGIHERRIHNFDPDYAHYVNLGFSPDGQRVDPKDQERRFYEAHRRINAHDRKGGYKDSLKIKEARKQAAKIEVSELNEAQAAFAFELQAEQALKQEAGIEEYLREVLRQTGEPEKLSPAGFYDAQSSMRERYCAVRSLELGLQGRSFNSVLLEGRPDAQGQAVPIHLEIHGKKGVSPKGVIWLSAGHGETALLYDEIIRQHVDDGYQVVCADARGQGFSGKPMGIDGYVDSAENFFLDGQRVLEFIEDHPQLGELPLFGFGFSQGAFLQSFLEQYNPGSFSALYQVSPIHGLGRRFAFARAPNLTELHRRNAIPKKYEKADKSAAYEQAQKWQDRGFMPLRFFRNESVAFWGRWIRWSLALAEAGRTAQAPTKVVIGEGDGHLSGEGVLENTRKIHGNAEVLVVPNRDHQLVLESEEHGLDFGGNSLAFFNAKLPKSPPPVTPQGRGKGSRLPVINDAVGASRSPRQDKSGSRRKACHVRFRARRTDRSQASRALNRARAVRSLRQRVMRSSL